MASETPSSKMLKDSVEYSENSIVSKQLVKGPAGNITLFAFDSGQGLSEHTAPFDAFVQVIEGRAEITIGGRPIEVLAGNYVIMPANIPHSVAALEKFKMLLVMIKNEVL